MSDVTQRVTFDVTFDPDQWSDSGTIADIVESKRFRKLCRRWPLNKKGTPITIKVESVEGVYE